jgi:hypothetical protein
MPSSSHERGGERLPSAHPLLAVAATCIGLALAAPTPPARGEDSPRTDGGAEVISLEDQLKTGLKARRPEEIEFIEDVVRAVNAGALPRKVVESTYVWAVRRRQTWPYPAFERALRIRADLLGVNL